MNFAKDLSLEEGTGRIKRTNIIEKNYNDIFRTTTQKFSQKMLVRSSNFQLKTERPWMRGKSDNRRVWKRTRRRMATKKPLTTLKRRLWKMWSSTQERWDQVAHIRVLKFHIVYYFGPSSKFPWFEGKMFDRISVGTDSFLLNTFIEIGCNCKLFQIICNARHLRMTAQSFF